MSNIVIRDTFDNDFTLSGRRALDRSFYATKTQIKNAIKVAKANKGENFEGLTIKVITNPEETILVTVFVAKEQITLGCHTFAGKDFNRLQAWLRRP